VAKENHYFGKDPNHSLFEEFHDLYFIFLCDFRVEFLESQFQGLQLFTLDFKTFSNNYFLLKKVWYSIKINKKIWKKDNEMVFN